MTIAIITAALIIVAFAAWIALSKYSHSGKAQKQSQEFLAKNQQNPQVHTTGSGLQYLVLKPAKPRDQFMLPQTDSTICIRCHGTLLDGTPIENTAYNPKSPTEHLLTFTLRDMLPGLAEGIALMQIGEEARFFIPSELAYGEHREGNIPPHSMLILDVKLVDFY